MQPKDELQRLARLVDMNKRLDEIEFQLERLQMLWRNTNQPFIQSKPFLQVIKGISLSEQV